MISKEDFRQKCSTLFEKNEIQEYRQKRKARTVALSISLPIEAFIALLIAIIIHDILSFIILPISAAIMVITLVVILLTTHFDLNEYKEKYMYGILALLLDGYKYEYTHKGYISHVIFDKSPYHLFYDRYYGEDLLEINIPNDDGSPSNVVLYLSDLDVTETHKDSDGNEDTTIIFDGCFGYIEFPFEFKCYLGINLRLKKTGKIKLEEIAFNKDFKVYTDNQLEALLILTPKMMKKLETFKDTSCPFSIAIENNKMYFSLHKNIFEMKKTGDELSAQIFDNIYDDVNTIISIVEEIKNNNKVFKM